MNALDYLINLAVISLWQKWARMRLPARTYSLCDACGNLSRRDGECTACGDRSK